MFMDGKFSLDVDTMFVGKGDHDVVDVVWCFDTHLSNDINTTVPPVAQTS